YRRYKMFRSHPAPEKMDKLFLAAGRAIARMPKLKMLDIDPGGWPAPCCDLRYNADRQSLTISSQADWRPSEGVLAVWAESAKTQIGNAELQIKVEYPNHVRVVRASETIRVSL